MRENIAFKLTEVVNNPENDFKKERQAYLTQRNARKREAQKQARLEIGADSSSDDEPVVRKPISMKENEPNERLNTSSSEEKADKESFRQAREQYKLQRLARKKEA